MSKITINKGESFKDCVARHLKKYIKEYKFIKEKLDESEKAFKISLKERIK